MKNSELEKLIIEYKTNDRYRWTLEDSIKAKINYVYHEFNVFDDGDVISCDQLKLILKIVIDHFPTLINESVEFIFDSGWEEERGSIKICFKTKIIDKDIEFISKYHAHTKIQERESEIKMYKKLKEKYGDIE